MSFMKAKWIKVLMVLLVVFAQTSLSVARASDAVAVGTAMGQSRFVRGPADTVIDMSPCRFSLSLLKDQFLQFNAPDLVFMASKETPKDSTAPYLWQAQLSSGYEWHFEKPGDLSEVWFGGMCENTANFSGLTPEVPMSIETSPELQLIRENNDLKCPATLIDRGWVPTHLAGRPETYVFESLSGPKSTGFIIGYHEKTRKLFTRIRFCLVHGDQVLVGSTENGSTPLTLSAEAFEGIKAVIRTIGFE
ncbi:hypothetical protein ACQKQA_19590 [Pseudomonas sp. NPDC089530]|uniref:hypothetical protein n=1 Tax=Pseudomonas sp. NPDC089530 TaxID=3390651 RepID=UPI003CFD4EEF